eukprot:3637883-Pleurochrysis_carterae.AAC.1
MATSKACGLEHEITPPRCQPTVTNVEVVDKSKHKSENVQGIVDNQFAEVQCNHQHNKIHQEKGDHSFSPEMWSGKWNTPTRIQ